MNRCTVPAFRAMVLTVLWLPWLGVHAYEEATHETITDHAFQAALTQGGVASRLTDLGMSAGSVLEDPYSTENVPNRLSVAEWVRAGSRHEDDGRRPLRHFFDPAHLAPGLCRGWGTPSRNWGLMTPGSSWFQVYSFNDARQYFLSGLTAATKEERDANLAEMFRALGQVMHLVQDLASPQHVRDDAHNPIEIIERAASAASCSISTPLYEKFIDDKNIRTAIDYDAYPLVTFATPEAYWGTGLQTGLAEFTNRNFLSEGTNFRHLRNGATDGPPGQHPFPQLDLSRKSGVPLNVLAPGNTAKGSVIVYTGDVIDYYNWAGDAGTPSILLTAYSLFDHDLIRVGREPIFTLNRGIFRDYARMLLPRATGYSGGLLSYFFRGSLDAQLDGGGRVTVHNTSAEAMDGEFALYYDDANGDRRRISIGGTSRCQTARGASNCLVIPAGDSVTLGTIAWPTSQAEPGRFFLVFSGRLGQEAGAIVGKMLDFTPFLFAPSDGFIGNGTWGPYNLTFPMFSLTITENWYTVDKYGMITHQHYSGFGGDGSSYAADVYNTTAFDEKGRLTSRTLNLYGIPCGYSRRITETVSYFNDGNGIPHFTTNSRLTVGCPDSPSSPLTGTGTGEVSAYNNSLPSPTGTYPAGTYIWSGSIWIGP